MTVCCANIVKACYGVGQISMSKDGKAFIAMKDGTVRVIDLKGKRHLEKIQLGFFNDLYSVHSCVFQINSK